MHVEILSEQQQALLPWVKQFRREFYLVGGTAIALYLGHRNSIDFDLFKYSALKPRKHHEAVHQPGFPYSLLYSETNQMHYLVNGVKVTFFQYPFEIIAKQDVDGCFVFPLIGFSSNESLCAWSPFQVKRLCRFVFLIKRALHYTASIKASINDLWGIILRKDVSGAVMLF